MWVMTSLLIIVVSLLIALIIKKKLCPCQESELNNNIEKAPITAPVPVKVRSISTVQTKVVDIIL
jgi:hypothetical protein